MIFDRVEEGRFVNGEWVMDRIWNGDQTDYGLNFAERPQVLRGEAGDLLSTTLNTRNNVREDAS